MLPYVNADTRKDELNRQFRNEFPKIRWAITLSKIRRLKKDMVQIFLKEPTMLKGFTEAVEEIDDPNESEDDDSTNQKSRTMSYIEVYSLA